MCHHLKGRSQTDGKEKIGKWGGGGIRHWERRKKSNIEGVDDNSQSEDGRQTPIRKTS